MPSLRRTLSSPAVRSSPYPSSLSTSAPQGGHRRSSGSETYGRRVLADIEWWRVAVGQHDADGSQPPAEDNAADQDQSQDRVVDETLGAAEQHASPADVQDSFAPGVAWTPYDATGTSEASSPVLPLMQIAALSIPPTTPVRRRHIQEGSSSSLESTPETPESPVETLRQSIGDLDLDAPDAPLSSARAFKRSRSDTLPAFFTISSKSFADYLGDSGDSGDHYADFVVSPFSSRTPDIFN